MDLCPPLLKLHTCSAQGPAPATRGSSVQPAQPSRPCPDCRLCCAGMCKLRSAGRGVGYLAIVIVQWLTDPFPVEARCDRNELEVFQPAVFSSETRAGVVFQGLRSGLGIALVYFVGLDGTLGIGCMGLLVICWQERSPCYLPPVPEFLRDKGVLEASP